nr:TetR/AcrR family transcriptional regulator [Streptomyces purpureus]
MSEFVGEPHRTELPTTGRPGERADAARNRRKILDAAARIVADRGPEALTMNAVAHACGVGVGTVYRRFGDVAQLVFALLDEREKQFQEAFLSGPPPLGPGAEPEERLSAFLNALTDRVVEQRELLYAAAATVPSARYTSGAYLTMHTHVAMLIGMMRPGSDRALLAHLALAPFTPALVRHLAVDQKVDAERIKDGLAAMLRLTCPPCPPP